MNDARVNAYARASIALAASLDTLAVGWFLFNNADPARLASAPRLLVAVATTHWLLLSLAAVAIVSLIFFARRNDMRAGTVALLILVILGETQSAVGPNGPQRSGYASGAVLLCYLLGAALSVFLRRHSASDPRRIANRFALVGARAGLAGIYVSSAVSKLRASSIAWVSAAAIQSTVASLAPLHGWRSSVAMFLISHATIALGLAGATLCIEGGAFFLVANGRVRRTWALLLIGVHLTIALLTDIVYLGNLILLFGIGLPGDVEGSVGIDLNRRSSNAALRRASLAAVVIVALFSLASLPARQRVESDSAAPPCRESRLGALSAGQSLRGWTVSSIDRWNDRVVVLIKRGTDDIAFVISASGGNTRRSPFDRPGVSISYLRTPVSFEDFRDAGDMLAGKLISTSSADDGVSTVRRWLNAPCAGSAINARPEQRPESSVRSGA